jgi:hypothetical protein
MSGKKISELQELLALENDDLLLVVDADEANVANKSKSVKISTLKAEVGSAADATTSSKGIIQLAGDLSGTADAPTVPGLANKYDASNPAGFVDASGAAAAAPVQQEDLEALDDRLIPIEGIFEFQHNVAYQNNAGIYANGQPGVEDALLRSGWYYENLVSGQKINWYFFDGNPLSPTFMADIEVQNFAAYAVVTFDSIASRPFLSVYTLPTGTNDIIPGFAHSSFAYSQYPITPDIGRKYLIHIGEAPAIHPELPRIQLGLSVGLGDQAPTEKVLAAALSSDSGASVGNVKFVAEHVGVNAPNLKANAELKIAKQNLLVSGTNIKTISGSSILGSGDLVINEARTLTADVFNNTGSPIPKMTVVYINGGQGDMPTVALAQATSESSSSKTFAVTAEPIGNMLLGKAVVSGALKGLDTTVFGAIEGASLYLSPTVAGGITATKPIAPDHIVSIGKLVRIHQNEGVIEVAIQNGYEIDELHNVLISGVTGGQVLKYDQPTSLWKNQTLTAADVGAATTSLSNLVTTAIPSGVDIISNSGSGIQFDVKTANSSTGSTGVGSFGSGSTTLGGSGYVELISGTGNAASGVAYVETGKASTGTSGSVQVLTGAIANDGYSINNPTNGSSTGAISLRTGLISSTFSYPIESTVKSGAISIVTGSSNSRAGSGSFVAGTGLAQSAFGFSGDVQLRSGDATVSGGASGNTSVLSGNVSVGSGASGSVLVRSGTTINGNSGQAQLTSGAVSGTGQSGAIVVRSGTTNSGDSGQVEFSSGSSTSGNSGATVITTGTAGGTRGNIYLLSPVIFTNDTSTETVVTTKNEIVAANLIDLLNMTGSVYHKNLTENVGFTFFSIPSNSGKKFTIVTKNATGSSYTVNFPTVKQKAGTINNTVAANTTSIFEFLISDNEIYCISCIDNIV